MPKELQKPLLDVIASQLSRLPPWLMLFVTSREEPQIKRALSSFKPKELRADEAKNRADVEVYLRTIARQHISPAGAHGFVQGHLRQVRRKVSAEDGYEKLIAEPEKQKRNDNLVHVSDDLDTVHKKQAHEAQEKLELLIADKWEADPKKETLRHPSSPGDGKIGGSSLLTRRVSKKEPLVSEKMETSTVAIRTSRGSPCASLAARAWQARLPRGSRGPASKFKNKYASPTPMGYSDLGISCAGVVLPDVVRYVCEIQLNHVDMLEAKKEAHVYNEEVCKELPALCQGTKVDAGELVAFIVGRLSTASLDAAVDAHSAKAEGLFLYAYMLGQHLESEAKKGRAIHFQNLDSLPAGLGEVYAVNFERAFPEGQEDSAWTEAKPLVELIAAAREPITVAMAKALLRWDGGQQERVLGARWQ